jgi:hypothetical protein
VAAMGTPPFKRLRPCAMLCVLPEEEKSHGPIRPMKFGCVLAGCRVGETQALAQNENTPSQNERVKWTLTSRIVFLVSTLSYSRVESPNFPFGCEETKAGELLIRC